MAHARNRTRPCRLYVRDMMKFASSLPQAMVAVMAMVLLCFNAVAAQAGNCKVYNCSYQFEPLHTCQCYPGCVQYGTCCTDYATVSECVNA